MTSIGSDTDRRPLTVFNPFDLCPVDTVPENTPEDVEAALASAHALFRDRDAWLPEYRRLAVLERTATLMEERFDQLSKIAVCEGGKPMTDMGRNRPRDRRSKVLPPRCGRTLAKPSRWA